MLQPGWVVGSDEDGAEQAGSQQSVLPNALLSWKIREKERAFLFLEEEGSIVAYSVRADALRLVCCDMTAETTKDSVKS